MEQVLSGLAACSSQVAYVALLFDAICRGAFQTPTENISEENPHCLFQRGTSVQTDLKDKRDLVDPHFMLQSSFFTATASLHLYQRSLKTFQGVKAAGYLHLVELYVILP